MILCAILNAFRGILEFRFNYQNLFLELYNVVNLPLTFGFCRQKSSMSQPSDWNLVILELH